MEDYEYVVTVPRLYVIMPGEPTIRIHISAVGGGTVGESYAHNNWEYAIESNGEEILSGSDLRSGGCPGTHADMAVSLAGFLSAAGESLTYSGNGSTYANEYPDGPVREFLISEHERLSMFCAENE